jgi:hypothetical protein
MTSLGDVYGGDTSGSLRRLYLGAGLFVVGSVLLLTAIGVTTTGVLTTRGFTVGEARELGGVLGGVGVPATLLGISTVLPASRRTRAASVVGASVSLLGVALFAHAYPCQWVGSTCGPASDLTLSTVGVYFLGTITTVWCLFVGVATFKTRNDPGGTARLSVVQRGRTDSPSRPAGEERSRVAAAVGGVGLLGATPDGDVETQTAPASDGGSAGTTVRTPTGTGREGGSGSRGRRDGTSGPSAGTGGRMASTPTDRAATDGAEVFHAGGSGAGPDGERSRTGDGSATDRTATGADAGAHRSGARDDAPPWAETRAESESRAERDRRERTLPGLKSDAERDDRDRSPSTDGGTRAAPVRTPVGRDRTRSRPASAGDDYCGTCTHFEYVRTDDGMRPYCAAHDRTMDDMTACDDWTGH